MKIALVSQEYPPETAHGGVGTQVYMRAHGLTGLGHTVYVISHSIDNKKIEYKDKDVWITRIPGYDPDLVPQTRSMKWLSYSFEVAKTINEIHKKNNLDLIVFPEYAGEGYIHLLNQTAENYIPSIVHIHGPLVMFAYTMDWPEIDSEFYRIGTLMEGESLQMADAVTASTSTSAGWCVKHYGIDGTDIPVLYTGIDTSHYYPREVPKSIRPTIIFVGAVRRTKGVRLLVESALILSEDFPNLHLRILGKGDPEFITELKELALKAGKSELVEFAGHVNREDLPDHLSQAHFFAGPSKYEGGPGNVYLEAMACGIPAIGCSGSGVDGVIVSGENGLLVPPDNVEELTKAMRSLLSDSNLCGSLGKRARAFALKEADSKVCIKRLEEYYKKISEFKFSGVK